MLVIVLAFISCSTGRYHKDKAEAEKQQRQIDNDLTERSREYTAAAHDVSKHSLDEAKLKGVPAEPEMELINMITREDERIEGSPIERWDIKPLLADLALAEQKLQEYGNENTQLLKERKDLNVEIEHLNELLKYERSNWFGNLWRYIKGFSFGGIVMLVAACFICPPLLGVLAPWIGGKLVSIFPKLISFFGVVSSKAFDQVMEGVQNIRRNLKVEVEGPLEKALSVGKSYTADEVKELMKAERQRLVSLADGALSDAQDQSTKNIVAQRKADKKVKSSTAQA